MPYQFHLQEYTQENCAVVHLHKETKYSVCYDLK